MERYSFDQEREIAEFIGLYAKMQSQREQLLVSMEMQRRHPGVKRYAMKDARELLNSVNQFLQMTPQPIRDRVSFGYSPEMLARQATGAIAELSDCLGDD